MARWASSDGSGEKEKIDWEKYKEGFTWYDVENKENFGSYKLPHHDIVDGEFKVVWRGVAAAMAALLGARGGVDIPDSDWDACYRHLANHYEQFEKEPPEKIYDDEENNTGKDEGKDNGENKETKSEKIGRILSEKNRVLISDAIKQMDRAIATLRELLKATEPPGDESKGMTNKGREPAGKEYLEYLAIKNSLQIADKAIEETLRKMKERLRNKKIKQYG